MDEIKGKATQGEPEASPQERPKEATPVRLIDTWARKDTSSSDGAPDPAATGSRRTGEGRMGRRGFQRRVIGLTPDRGAEHRNAAGLRVGNFWDLTLLVVRYPPSPPHPCRKPP